MGFAPNALTSVKAAQVLFFVNAATWLLLGITSHTTARLIVALLMFGNAGAMLVAGVGIGNQRRSRRHA